MREANIQTELNSFFRQYGILSRAFTAELKLVDLTKTKYFQLSKVRPHQKEFIKELPDSFTYKIIDSVGFGGVGRFTDKKPFDFFYMPYRISADHYLAIAFWKPYKIKKVYFILSSDFYLLEERKKKIDMDFLKNVCQFEINLLTKKATFDIK